VKIPKVQLRDPFEYGAEPFVLLDDGITQTVACSVEIGKEPFDVRFGRITVRRTFDVGKDFGKIGIEVCIALAGSRNIIEKLTWVDEIPFCLYRILFDLRGDDIIRKGSVVYTLISSLYVVCEVLADKAVKERTQHILFEIPTIHRTTNIVSDLPDLSLEFGALLGACHSVILISVFQVYVL